MYPALGCINDEDYKKYAGPKVIYLLKASATENSLIHSNCYTQLANGSVRFLIPEQEAKVKLNNCHHIKLNCRFTVKETIKKYKGNI